jgi:hypothetical protein
VTSEVSTALKQDLGTAGDELNESIGRMVDVSLLIVTSPPPEMTHLIMS